MTEHAPLELERFLPYRLSILSNRISQAIAREYQSRFDLSMTEWRVMAVLARFDSDGLSASEVAARTEMDKVAVSRALARLVAARREGRRMLYRLHDPHLVDLLGAIRHQLEHAERGWSEPPADPARADAHA